LKRALSAAVLAVAALFAVLALQVSPSSAAPSAPSQDAGCFPGSDPDYPPTGPAVQIEASLQLVSGHFVPGGGSDILIVGATGGTYCGLGYSTVFTLPFNQPDAQGRLVYDDVPTPADFELGAMHHIDVFKNQVKVGNFDFCVDKKGDLAPTSACNPAQKPGKGSLPKTGANHLADLVRLALVLIGVGGGLYYVRRRQLQSKAG
jgi:LPXTG-motif cell wall-anchored protein